MRAPRLRIVVRYRAMRGRLARFVGGSAAAHGLLLAVILIVPLTRQRVAPIQDTMMVALAGPIGGSSAPAPRASGAPAPAKPAAAPAPKEAHTVREVPVPKAPKAKEKPDKPKKDVPKSPEPETPATPESPDEAPDVKPDAAQAKPGAGSGAGAGAAGAATGVTASLGGGDAALGWYGAAVKAALESAWAKPYLEDQGETFSVVVTFEIARDGSTSNVRIVTSSGVPSLDRSVLRAVIEASPLPAVPPTWKDATLPATMRFDLNPETR
jgi:periplasmic protein TonB